MKSRKSVARKSPKKVSSTSRKVSRKPVARKSVTRKSVARKPVARKSVTRKSVARKPVARKTPKKVSKDDMYHVSLELAVKKAKNQPTRQQLADHLKNYLDSDDKYLLVDYNNQKLMQNISLDGTKLKFDVPKSISESLSHIASKESLKKHISNYSHLGDTVYGHGYNNFFEIDEHEIYPKSVVVK
jgi:hypothetical protein